MNILTAELIELTNQPYDEYNTVLPVIKHKLGSDRASTFEAVLAEELPLTTARRAYRAAIKVAMGEPAYRETEQQHKKSKETEK